MFKSQAVELWNILKYLENEINTGKMLVKTKFSYIILTNLSVLDSLVEIIKKVGNPDDMFKKYDEERATLAKTYAEKDKDNQPIIENNSYKLSGDGLVKFNEEFKKLGETHKDTLEKRRLQLKEVEDILKEDVEIVLSKVKLDLLPESGITPAMLNILDPILEK
jgi:hypothetical protein